MGRGRRAREALLTRALTRGKSVGQLVCAFTFTVRSRSISIVRVCVTIRVNERFDSRADTIHEQSLAFFLTKFLDDGT
jgi:hypothetical protein